MSRSRSDDGGGAGFAVLLIIAVIWWLRWFILAAVVVTVAVLVTRRLLRRNAQRREAELARIAAIRQRADTQHEQVLRGDPAGFFGAYPVPDPELIPRWYTIDRPVQARPAAAPGR